MQAMGRLGGYISRSVSNVSGTFHPFSGSVDVIVVEQPDGSFKSSPWYVRFGKFQGVLKTKEKVVGIIVNGVEADFHMYLDSRGEAYFLKEVDVEEEESNCSPPFSSGEDMDGQPVNGLPLKSESFNYDSNFSDSIIIEGKSVNRISSLSYRRLGLIFGSRRSLKEERILNKENATDFVRTDSFERAEIAADLLELKWSTNLSSSLGKKVTDSHLSSVDNSNPVADDSSDIDCCSHIKTNILSNTSYQELESTVEDDVEMKCLTSESTVETAISVESVGEDTIPGPHKSMVDKLVLDESEFRVSSVSFSNTSFCKEDRAEENVQYRAEAEKPVAGLEGHEGQNNSSFCYFGYGGVGVLARTVQDTAEERYLLKPEQERNPGHSLDPLNKEVCLEKRDQLTFIHEEEMFVNGETIEGASERLVTKCYSEKLGSIHQSNDSCKDNESQNVTDRSPFEEQTVLGDMHMQGSLDGPSSLGAQISACELLPPYNQESRILKEHCLSVDLDDFVSTYAQDSELKHADLEGKEAGSSCSSIVAFGGNELSEAKWCSMPSLDQSIINDYVSEENFGRRRLRPIASEVYINRIDNTGTEELTAISRSLPNMGPLSHNFIESDTGSVVASGTNRNHLSLDPQAMAPDDVILMESKERPSNSSIGNPPSNIGSLKESPKRTWSLSLKRSKSKNLSHVETSSGENTETMENSSALEGEKDGIKVNIRKKLVRTLIPTSEQLAALNLKQGKNLVAFTFSTAMLGKQQVDAHIFLWRWDTRIVISDVDGTITRSDVLGQFMPLVGRDWSQSGVAHLFTAIKENGYQLLFLSARSIAQSFLTRQFLFNIKQDGKALPEGPVVISPDGLFPSLFREVIRRAPHEFKVACLEDIKALFPADRNPFYAGFGNRDTDEFSYLKVGIPRGKIFIINPKGEIVVNRHVDTKSYSSLHSLVHDMFPTILSSEEFQEGFNSWNFWKLPTAIID